MIEGLDGSGKATQSKILYEKLLDLKYDTRHLSYPCYNSDSSALVKMYLNGELSQDLNDINAYAASAFYAVDRCADFIKNKDLYKSSILISDRYVTSNMIYQAAKLPDCDKDYFLNWLSDFEYDKLGITRPDLVIYLDVDVNISQKLMSARYKNDDSKKDIHERNVNYLKSCHEAALYISEKYNWNVIKCDDGRNLRSINDISNDIFNIVSDFLKEGDLII